MQTFILILICLFMGVFALVTFGMANAKKFRYVEKITYLEEFVDRCSINKVNYDIILQSFSELLWYNDDETRTRKLFNHFSMKFGEYWLREKQPFLKIHNQIMAS